jgi:hypothetical protein
MTDKTSKKSANPTASASPLFSMNQFKPALEWMERWSRAAPQVGAGVPGFSQWIAPTLDPKELEKRIGDLRTVHFWLEQNARVVAATIQALEVQRMTLNTLQSMNVPLQSTASGASQPSSRESAAPPSNDAAPRAKRGGGAKGKAQPAADVAAALSRSGIDAVNWWNAMTEQFGQLASQAMKDVAASGQAMSTAATAAAQPAAAKASNKAAPKAASKAPAARRSGTAGGRR